MPYSLLLVSSVGSQMQLAALGWVIAVLTGSATKVSLVAFATIIPLVVLSPVAGSLTDRSFTEMLTLTTAICSIPPFAYSMYLWNQIPEHGEVFNNALAQVRLGTQHDA